MLKQTTLTLAEVNELLNRLRGLAITRTWRGYGPAIFFEIGKLDKNDIGEFTFMADKDWILCLNDDNCKRCNDLELEEMDKLLKKFVGLEITKVKFNEKQLIIELDHNKSLIIDDFRKNNWGLEANKDTIIFYKGGFVQEKRN
jgi:hypothetical protein